ncbi:MAG: hypothetical protein GTN74_00690 [Proteobacteria bacterium]|nr:hypothetical protein [Pseudomonadota bacterium]NIS67531.1 hypothetical protein [Pseudomonadota bacterium]
MLRLYIVLFVTVSVLGGVSSAHCQKMTEIFIPIGQSPGLSGKYSIIGKIETVNSQGQTITIVDPSGSHIARITERTKIWLDKSKLGLSNQKGSFADLRKGLTVEVNYEKPSGKEGAEAEWIKVEISGG